MEGTNLLPVAVNAISATEEIASTITEAPIPGVSTGSAPAATSDAVRVLTVVERLHPDHLGSNSPGKGKARAPSSSVWKFVKRLKGDHKLGASFTHICQAAVPGGVCNTPILLPRGKDGGPWITTKALNHLSKKHPTTTVAVAQQQRQAVRLDAVVTQQLAAGQEMSQRMEGVTEQVFQNFICWMHLILIMLTLSVLHFDIVSRWFSI